jgi:hypothetical protein
MYDAGFPILGTFSLPRILGVDATPAFAVIPPFRGGAGGPKQSWTLGALGSNKERGQGRAHVTKMAYTPTATAHLLTIMRPLNFTLVNAAVVAGATAITIADDPGLYSTNYKYGPPPAQSADNPIDSNDYIVVQLADGSWWAAIVTAVSAGPPISLTVAAIPTASGASPPGILKGALLYLMGEPADVNPFDGQVHPSIDTTAATGVRELLYDSPFTGAVEAHSAGDPMLWYSPNTTNHGTLELLHGFYSER